MAKVDNNIVTSGLRGKLGDLIVFRTRGGKTFVSKSPNMPNSNTEAQQKHRKKFQQAVSYAKAALDMPEIKAAYAEQAKPGATAFNVAMADFFHAPHIHEVDLSSYTGQLGDLIRIVATDDFMVAQVSVSIIMANGNVIEQGEAVAHENTDDWIYTSTVEYLPAKGDFVRVSASDLPGNNVEKTVPIL